MLQRFGHDVLQLQAMTPSLPKLDEALTHLTDPYPEHVAHNRGGTLFYDAVFEASQAMRSNDHGRRAIIMITDGEDHASRHTLDEALIEAQSSDIVIYSINYVQRPKDKSSRGNSSHPAIPPPSPTSTLSVIARETGGRTFNVFSDTKLDKIFATIIEDLRAQYEFAYTPPDAPPNTFHHIELTAIKKNLTLRAPAGYVTR